MTIQQLAEERFGLPTEIGKRVPENATLGAQLSHRSHRDFKNEAVSDDLLQTLFAAAFSVASKSDLQQVSVIRVQDKAKQVRIADLSPHTTWVANSPVFMVWCGDSRRIRRLAEWREHPFANDHLDAFMNAAVDTAIVMQNFIVAAEAVGLGCCPVSEIRDQIEQLSAELKLPKWVFPVAGLCVGWPAENPAISLRLPLETTVHIDGYDDGDLFDQVADYDRRREDKEQTKADQQRMVETFGVSDNYGWSENRTRQYSKPSRADFGAYIRKQGFSLK